MSSAAQSAELTRVLLQNEELAVTVLPELGGKISSIRSKRSGREFLLQPPERPYRRAFYSAPFDQYDTSGFDECFPTVSECLYGTDGKQVLLPDHGELWSAAWQYSTNDGEMQLAVDGRALPYAFRKRLRLEGSRLITDYVAENLGTAPMHALWSAHPLLAPERGARILLPPEVQQVFVNWSRGDRLGSFGDTCAWPQAGGEDLSLLQGPGRRTAHKLFTARLKQGYCGLQYPDGETLMMRFDASLVPFIGLWICQGGWPVRESQGHFTVALEPCSGRPDSLAEAVKTGECDTLIPGQPKRWQMTLEIQPGAAASSSTESDTQ